MFFLFLCSYNYNREDEEIYKEVLEVANDLVPGLMKTVNSDNVSRLNSNSILCDPDFYANFIRFYDGICEWEEDSTTPVLHIGWANHLVFSLSKFNPRVRGMIQLHAEGIEDDDSDEDDDDDDDDPAEEKEMESNGNDKKIKESEKEGQPKCVGMKGKNLRTRSRSTSGRQDKLSGHPKNETTEVNDEQKKPDFPKKTIPKVNGNDEEQIKSAIADFVSKAGDDVPNDSPNANIAALAQACSDSILNPEFLLGSGEPFTTATTVSITTTTTDSRVDYDEFLSTKSNGTPFMGMTVDSMLKAESPADMMLYRNKPDRAHTGDASEKQNLSKETDALMIPIEKVPLNLRSEKMKGLRKLLSSTKLNSSAIKLQLTAQSQVQFRHAKRQNEADLLRMRKRTRRE